MWGLSAVCVRMRVACAAAAVVIALLTSGCAVAPEPLTEHDMVSFAAGKRLAATADQEPVKGPIDLYEAIARALKYNLDARVEQLQAELRVREIDLASDKMLPSLVAGSAFQERNNDSGGTSQSLITKRESLEPSRSQERRGLVSDLTFSWNILDFGLSYVRARQAGDEALIANESRRKAVNRIIEDVRTAYWRAVTSERLQSQLKALEQRVLTSIRQSKKLYSNAEVSRVTALTYERELVGIKREIQSLDGELKVAKTQLAALMNLDPTVPFKLVRQSHGLWDGMVQLDTDGMIDLALRNRPELAEVALKKRINKREAEAALLELLPGLQLYLGANRDSNTFLFNNDWVSWGSRASWNVLKLVQYPARRSAIDAQDELLDARALAVTMAVMTQIYVSRIRIAQTKKELATADEYLDVQSRLVKQMRAQAASDKISEQTLIREEMNTLLASAKRDLAYATYQNAIGNVYASLGLDPCDPEIIDNNALPALTDTLRRGQGWRGGFVETAKSD